MLRTSHIHNVQIGAQIQTLLKAVYYWQDATQAYLLDSDLAKDAGDTTRRCRCLRAAARCSGLVDKQLTKIQDLREQIL